MKTFDFQRAVPIWAKEREREMNCELAFRAAISGAEAVLRLTASSIYRVWMNGEFVAAGPARAAHGFYRVDEISLTPYLKLKRNTLVVEVVAFNVNSYDTLDQPGFLTAEVIQNDKVTAATGDASFAVFDLHERIQRIQRYSSSVPLEKRIGLLQKSVDFIWEAWMQNAWKLQFSRISAISCVN